MKARLIFIACWLPTLAGCTCSSDVLCPEGFGIGQPCEIEMQECIYPESLCGTPCRCVNQPGGFVWECATQYCKCTCDCGRYAIASCEMLECTEEDDPCVAQALPLCEMICTDDDAGTDGPRDAGVDQDGTRDLGVLEAGPDAPRDLAADVAKPREAAVDQRADQAVDQRADLQAEQSVDQAVDQRADTAADQSAEAVSDSITDLTQDADH